MAIDLSQRDAALQQFWEQASSKYKSSNTSVSPEDWNRQLFFLSQSGIGAEEALAYLYSRKPAFDEFLNWLQLTYRAGESEFQELSGNMLSAEDIDFWNRNGFLVVKNAVSKERCELARAAIWEFLGADPATPESWYLPHDGKNGLMLNFFQHAALDGNRNSARIRKVYQELYGDTDIYLLVDKVSFNPPENGKHRFTGSPIHWDVSLQLPIPFVLQGLLYLSDVGEDDGAFHCVPGFHRQIDTWLAGLPGHINPREAALTELALMPVPGNAGDLVIWHQALPHCATPNTGKSPRMVQYIAYKPVKAAEASVWR